MCLIYGQNVAFLSGNILFNYPSTKYSTGQEEIGKKSISFLYYFLKEVVAASNTSTEKASILLEQCREGVKAFKDSDEFKLYLSTLKKFRTYSANNCMLILMQFPNATLVAGYRMWKDKFNRHVKKNEKGIKILAPLLRKNKAINETDKEASEEQILYGFRVVTVFDISQTEGDPLPSLNYPMDYGEVENANHFFDTLSEYTDFQVKPSSNLGNIMGICKYEEKEILINIKFSKKHQIATLVHEIAHSKLHHPNDPRRKQTTVSIRELEAESVSFIVCEYFGIEYKDFSFRYISSYCKSEKYNDFFDSMEKVKLLASEIIDFLESNLVEITEVFSTKGA